MHNHISSLGTGKWILILLVLGSAMLRLQGIAWDNYEHMHPDERMLILTTEKLALPGNLNPHFFSYGSFPMYALRFVAQVQADFTHTPPDYLNLLPLARLLSIVVDTITLLLIVFLTLRLTASRTIALLTGALWAITPFSIQNSHFFIVDNLFACLTVAGLYTLIIYLETKHINVLVLLGVILGLLVATKFTGILLIPIALYSIVWHFWKKKTLQEFMSIKLTLLATTLFTSFIAMPYMYLDWQSFTRDISQQLQMNSNAYIFPYTLQYVGTLPYVYPLYNIVFWGLGLGLSILTGIGFFRGVQYVQKSRAIYLRYLYVFMGVILIILGRSEVKFMRYLYMLYPFFVMFGALGLYYLYTSKQALHRIAASILFGMSIVYTAMFLTIYYRPNTRIQAAQWIHAHIPEGSHLAVEHWDDRVPGYSDDQYVFQELTLYDRPDDRQKWQKQVQTFAQSDYIIIASNRLYKPLQRLKDCNSTPKACYPNTAEYYRRLFAGEEVAPGITFKKIQEFTSYPHLSLFGHTWELRDDTADESFTVYDHPKIMVFQKQ